MNKTQNTFIMVIEKGYFTCFQIRQNRKPLEVCPLNKKITNASLTVVEKP